MSATRLSALDVPGRGLLAARAPGRDGVLLTGATGFVGIELLARYLQLTDRDIFVLIRATDDEHARARLEETLVCAFGTAEPYLARVRALAGDLTHDGLGLDPDTAIEVAAQVSEIVHGAAAVSADLPLGAALTINVEGTRRMLAFAELCAIEGGLRRLTHVSTAHVAGLHRGRFTEDDLDVGQRFRNHYEQSKFEAEILVRDTAARLPITVVRPSIVVGDRHSGWTASFNVLYEPLRALDGGSCPPLPARRRAPVDVVSVDYVADAIVALAGAPGAEGQTFHLTASEDASSVAELLALAVERFGCKLPPRLCRRVVHPRLRPRGPRGAETSLAIAATFDNTRARAALAPAIAPAPLASYFDALVDHALEARWGARPLTRAAANGARPAAALARA